MAAAVAAGNSVAGVFAWKTRAGRGADLFIHSNPSNNRKTERSARGKNSDDAAAGFTRDLRRCACASQIRKNFNQVEASGVGLKVGLDGSGFILAEGFKIGGKVAAAFDSIPEM